MLSAKQLAAIEAQITWGHPNEPGLTNHLSRQLVDEIRRLEREASALRDGLRGWKEIGATAQRELKDVREKLSRAEITIADAEVVLDKFDYLDGTLAERIAKTIDLVRSPEDWG